VICKSDASKIAIMIKRSKTNSKNEKANLQRSSAAPVIRRYGQDSYKYFEKGRFTIIEGELTHDGKDVDRIIFYYCPMKWSDSEKRLTAGERKKVFKAVGEYLDKEKIKWKFSYWR
jgi:hypothetical protein